MGPQRFKKKKGRQGKNKKTEECQLINVKGIMEFLKSLFCYQCND